METAPLGPYNNPGQPIPSSPCRRPSAQASRWVRVPAAPPEALRTTMPPRRLWVRVAGAVAVLWPFLVRGAAPRTRNGQRTATAPATRTQRRRGGMVVLNASGGAAGTRTQRLACAEGLRQGEEGIGWPGLL